MRCFALLAVLVACSKSEPAPSCAQVMDHILEVSKQQIMGHGDMVLGQRDAMIAQCEARELSADKRRCLFAANTLDAIASCKAGDASAAPGPVPERPRRHKPEPRVRE